MKDFKKMPKMACGGKVKKYESGGEVKNYTPDPKIGYMFAEKYKKGPAAVNKEIITRQNYQDSPDYMGKEDDSTSGRAAASAYDSKSGEPTDYYKTKDGNMSSRSGVKRAQQAAKTVKEAEKVNPMGDTFKRGGKVKRGNKKK
jgi:hypothetical protein